MVSSKCCQVVSPSPFKFLAALIPPCAQTECERFTGTTENRSTLPPFSAILMTAASPASPPPTTMTLGLFAILQFLLNRSQKLTTEITELHRGKSHRENRSLCGISSV